MTGYCGYSMSNNAVKAYEDGLVPASKIKGVPAALVQEFCTAEEWHHTSNRYNRTDFYDASKVRVVFGLPISDEERQRLQNEQGYDESDFAPKPAAVAALKNKGKKEAVTVHERCYVEWIEWSGTRNHPKATERGEAGCTVAVKGQTATITLPSGYSFQKRLSTNGFSFRVAK